MSTPEERLRRVMASARGEDRVTEGEWEAFSASAHRSLRIQRIVAGAVAILVLAVGGGGAVALFNDGPADEPIPPAASQTPDDCVDIDAPNNPDACNYQRPPSDGPTPNTSPTALPGGIDLDPPPETMGEIWLVDPQTKTLSWGYREIPGEAASLEVVLTELFRSPIASDVEAGVTSEIPKGTALRSAEVIDGVAHVDLSADFDDDERGRGTMRLREAQVVFTATQIEGVDAVYIYVEDEPYLGQVNPTTRGDYDDIAPPIVVETPTIGQEVSDPFTVAGTANVFEGTVSLKLVIAQPGGDKIVISEFATATCGSGCRGEFSKKLGYPDLKKPADATLNVYEESAEDGARLHEVSIPITLLPND